MPGSPRNYRLPLVSGIADALEDHPELIHIIVGPRQVGKTTAASQIAEAFPGRCLLAAADSPVPHGPEWIHSQWEMAEEKARNAKPFLLILDEIQKIPGWSETVKLLWDKARRTRSRVRLLLLGSSSLLVRKGLSDSLSGRFFLHRASHWDYAEMKKAFGYDLKRWLFYGGYPGASRLDRNPAEWAAYVTDSLIETVLNRDILQLSTIAKPALLRHLFMLAAARPAQILSYNKMLGQLQDAGNTTTLAHYLILLDSAFLVRGLECYRGGRRPKRASSPKLIVRNNALVSALSGLTFEEAYKDRAWWGRLVENAVGAVLLNRCLVPGVELFYWRDGGQEVDFVLKTSRNLWAIEVKSGRPGSSAGLQRFLKFFKDARPVILGESGEPLEDFFSGGWRRFL